MAKEKTLTAKVYELTDYIKKHKYEATIDGRYFLVDFERNFKGEPTTSKSGVGELNNNGEFKIKDVAGFSDLTPLQVRELAYANVIKVTDDDKELIHGKTGG